MKYEIQSDRLSLRFRYEPQRLFSERFESCGVIEQVWLDERYQFCEPEQRIAPRMTCHGTGLCGEYVWNELAQEVSPGELFPKIGVGLLTQRPEGGPYEMFKHYQVEPFPTTVQMEPNRAIFIQEGKECLGIATRITKIVTVQENELTTETTLENIGARELNLEEYQHNFVSNKKKKIGPGHDLHIPFDGTIEQISAKTFDPPHLHRRFSGYQQGKDHHIQWVRHLGDYAYHKQTPAEDLHPEKGRFWKLTRTGSPLSVEEHFFFDPSLLVIWGMEHCACVEVYVPLQIAVRNSHTWKRVWRFCDEFD